LHSALRTWSNGGAVGWETFCLSLPAIVGRAGIDRVIPPIMPPNEERALKASAAIIRQHIGGIAGATRSQHSSCVVKNARTPTIEPNDEK